MRCAEPEMKKKKLLVIGESIFFGPKILDEKGLWCYQLKDILHRNNISDWEIFNAGFPGYNTYQYRAWWEKTLKKIEPDIVIIQCGVNDITQAYVMGEKWEPGLPWQWDFIMRQQRKTKWWQKLLFHNCLYFMYRRKKITERKGFEPDGNVFKLRECMESISCNAGKIVSDAKSMGVKVLFSSLAMAYDPASIEKDPPQLDSIQANWRESLISTGIPMINFSNWWKDEFARQMGCPSLNLQKIFQVHPKRYEMYLDVAHWNEAGHKLAAESIFNRLVELNWW
jgi:lysophospholipase L1-like esterase